MVLENGRQEKAQGKQRPQSSLHIVPSNAGVDRWRALWNWLLAPEPPTEPAAKESEVADDDSHGLHTNHRSSRENNEEG